MKFPPEPNTLKGLLTHIEASAEKAGNSVHDGRPSLEAMGRFRVESLYLNERN
jgi:hypothetical protein